MFDLKLEQEQDLCEEVIKEAQALGLTEDEAENFAYDMGL